MKYSQLLLPPEIRASLIEGCAAGTIPPLYVDEVCDLALHGARQAVDAMERCIKATPDERISISALGISASLLVGVLPALLAALEQTAAVHGCRSAHTGIKL
jgi:hypothetical protein